LRLECIRHYVFDSHQCQSANYGAELLRCMAASRFMVLRAKNKGAVCSTGMTRRVFRFTWGGSSVLRTKSMRFFSLTEADASCCQVDEKDNSEAFAYEQMSHLPY